MGCITIALGLIAEKQLTSSKAIFGDLCNQCILEVSTSGEPFFTGFRVQVEPRAYLKFSVDQYKYCSTNDYFSVV